MAAHQYHVGDRVVDRESGKRGVVVYVFSDLTLKDVVVVKFDGRKDALAVNVNDLATGGGHDQYQHKED
jgi:hypothetical protein